ncbi:MAG: LpxD N-terminal domain-containing protein, partial [Bacteroidota bacterium]
MKLSNPVRLRELAELTGSRVIGNGESLVYGINEIHKVEQGDITFVDHPKYYDKALASAATFVIINKEVESPKGKSLLFHNDPFSVYNQIVAHFRIFTPSSSAISPSARIGEGTVLQPGVFVGNDVMIGRNCLIHSNVSIYDNSVIGDEVVIHANT